MVTTLSNSPTPSAPRPMFCVNQAATTRRFPFKLEDLVPLPSLTTTCGVGFGLAACPSLGLLVSSDYHKNTISAWALPDITPSGGVPGEAPVLAVAGAVEGLEGASASSSPGTGCDGLTLRQ